MLYIAVEQAPSAEVVEPAVLRAYFSQFDEKFFHYCDKELAKINTFFSGKPEHINPCPSPPPPDRRDSSRGI